MTSNQKVNKIKKVINLLFFLIIIIIFIILAIIFLCLLLSKTNEKENEKSSPIECGINPISIYNTPFSIQFFLIAIIFIIFDVEIALIIPIPLTNIVNIYVYLFTSNIFLIILLIGIIYEWYNGALEWVS